MYKNKTCLAIIPARGGSKGVVRKNIKPLLGRPLIYWTINELAKSKYLDRIIVSTDDPEISRVAKSLGAEVPFLRPAEIAGDLATDVEFMRHAFDWFKENESKEYDVLLRLPPTSPLRRAEQVDKGIELLIDDERADSVRPITPTPKHPHKMWRVKGDYIEPFVKDEIEGIKEPWNSPRQLLPNVYIHSGAMDIVRKNTLLDLQSTSGKVVRYFHMSSEDSINIDSEIDFQLAELLMKRRLTR